MIPSFTAPASLGSELDFAVPAVQWVRVYDLIAQWKRDMIARPID